MIRDALHWSPIYSAFWYDATESPWALAFGIVCAVALAVDIICRRCDDIRQEEAP